jgi:protein Mpv17
VIDNFFQSQPYLSAFVTCSVKATAADVLAQVRENGDGASSTPSTAPSSNTNRSDGAGPVFLTYSKTEATTKEPRALVLPKGHDLDWQRTSAFLFYGGLYQGLFQEFLYAGLFPAWFPSSDWQSVVSQVLLDMSFFSVCLCLPVAYIFKYSFMMNEATAPGSTLVNWEIVRTALRKYKSDVQERGLLFKYWGIWIPVQTLNFSVIPTHFRVAFVAVVSFFWMFVLSTTSAQGDEEYQEKS